MKKETLFEEFETIVNQLGVRVVKDKGAFRSDSCVLENERVIVINKLYPIESRLAIMARFLHQHEEKLPFIKPAVRKELEVLWNTTLEN